MNRHEGHLPYRDSLVDRLQFEFDRLEAIARDEFDPDTHMQWTGRIVVEDDMVLFETAEPHAGWMGDGGPGGPYRIVWTDDLEDLRDSAYPPHEPRHCA